MRILLVSQPARDGVLRHVTGLCDFLLSAGDVVHLGYSDHNASDQLPPLVEQIRSAGGAILNLGVRNAPQPRDLLAILRLRSFIDKVAPDVIHAHSSKAGALVRALGLLGLHTPIIYTPHSYYRMHDRRDRRASIFHRLERSFARVGTTVTMSRCESVFAEQVIGVPLSRQLISANGVDFAEFSPATAEARNALRTLLGFPQTARILGSVGRMSPQKDPLSMYTAFAEAAVDLPDVHLVHLGQGELAHAVDELIASRGMSTRCHRIPYMSPSAPFYRGLDGFLLTSLYEGMSYAVLEALATNLPLILTRSPGNLDFGDHGFSHLNWCDPGKPLSIAEAIRHWRRRLDHSEAPNHRSISRRHFAMEVAFLTIRKAYQQHVDTGRPAKSYV